MSKKKIVMAQSVAIWLAKNTKLTNNQIAEFSGIDRFIVANYRNQNLSSAYDPVAMGMISLADIKKCENDPDSSLKLIDKGLTSRTRMDKKVVGSAILWVITEYPDVTNLQLRKLFNCTENFIQTIRDGSFKEYDQLINQNPLTLGLFSSKTLEEVMSKNSKTSW